MNHFGNSHLYCEEIQHIASLELPWEQLKGKRILLTGASGLIGSILVDVLMQRNLANQDGIELVAVGRNEETAKSRLATSWNRPRFRFLRHDVNHPLPEIGDIDYIIHAASNTHPIAYASDPVGTITTNIIGTSHLLNYAACHAAQRFMFISTIEVYGENRGDTETFDERYCGYIDCNTLRAGYPESKRAGEALCQAYRQKYGLEVSIARLCKVYGPTMMDSDSKALAQFIRNALHGEDIVLKSDGTQMFSYIYTADAVSALLTILLQGGNGEAYNIADDKSDITLRDLAQSLAKLSGTKVVFEIPNQVEKLGFSSLTKSILDAGKLQKLGWKAKFDINQGLKRTIDILKNQ